MGFTFPFCRTQQFTLQIKSKFHYQRLNADLMNSKSFERRSMNDRMASYERRNGRPMNRIWIKVANYPKALLCVQKQWHEHLHRLKCVILKANFGGSPTSYRINELIQWKISLSKLHAENGASEKVKSYKEWITTKQKQEGSNRIAESDSDWPQANINPNRKWCGT